MKTQKVAFLLLFFVLLIIATGYPGTTGKLSGRVTDAETKEPIPGANILIEGTTLGAMAGPDGYYFVINIPPGRYNVLFSCMGYENKRVESVRISVDATKNLSMAMGSTVIEGQEVTVVAERALVQKDLTSSSARVSSDQMELLPVETVSEVVNLQAGVVNGHFRGGRLGEVAYLIDGLSVNDAYTGSQMISLEPNSIEEVEVISGTFNAEYGQAMSGVVNIVSKEPQASLAGQFSAYTGAYLSGRSVPFATKTGDGLKREDYYEKEVAQTELASLGDVYDLQGSLSGALYSDKVLFFSSVRQNKDDGYLYGARVFMPSDSSSLPSNRDYWQIDATGDGEYVPMSWSKRLTAHGKFILKPLSSHKMTYEFVYENGESQGYSHMYKYNPDGLPTNHSESFSHMLHYDYVINPSGFINFKFANLTKEYKSYLYEDPYDSRYVPDTRFDIGAGRRFYMAGTSMSHSYRQNTSNIFKADLTYQIDRFNQIKFGSEVRMHTIDVESFLIRMDRITNWQPRPVEKESPNYTDFVKNPYEISAYIQDRIEWSYFIMNLGLRYDLFEPDGEYPSDLTRPSTSSRFKASQKSQVSPRFGVAVPITEQSVLHLSYGLFFQMPSFNYLYTNPEFRIPVGSFATIGNTNLEPQRTATYEIGVQHALTNDVAVDATVYYKDIRNLLGMEVYTLLPSFDKYARYVNKDYGQTLGFTIAFEQRSSDFFTTTVDYTYMVAEGNSSDPRDTYLKSQTTPPTEITKQLIFLDWDRTHSLNLTARMHDKDLWNLGIIGQFGSGFPYTPQQEGYYPSRENDERKPYYVNVDVNFAISFRYGRTKTTLFTNIYNIFDIDNEINIFQDTGRATYTLEEQYHSDDAVKCINTVSDYYYRPDYLGSPRKVVVGMKFEF